MGHFSGRVGGGGERGFGGLGVCGFGSGEGVHGFGGGGEGFGGFGAHDFGGGGEIGFEGGGKP